MKLLSILLCLLLLTGCASTAAKLETAGETVENALETAEEKIETQIEAVTHDPAPTMELPNGMFTEDDAKAIALEHAGLTEDRVEGLRVSFETDDGVPEYDVDFRIGVTEYEYTIHAETGAILSYEIGD